MIPHGFTARMQALLGPEYTAFAESYSCPRNVGLRLNPLKADPPPVPEGFSLRPVPWAENGFFYDPHTRPGLHPWHEAGLYYMQEPSAMAPAELLDIRPGMRVLDLCAAPGGKSTQLAAKLNGRGILVSNEIHPQRARILSRNLERCAAANVLVLNEHPARLAERFTGWFDRIVVDAPCSGEGMFRKEEAAGQDWSEDIVQMCADRQYEVLCSAAEMLAPGGRLVYSTCTFAPQENEGVVSRFLRSHPDFSVADVKNQYFSPGRPDWIDDPAPGLERTFRLWPHKLSGEGHYAAVLEKAQAGGRTELPSPAAERLPGELDAFRKELSAALPEGKPVSFGQTLYLAPEETPELRGLKVLRPGLELGQVLKGRFEPAHAWALWLKEAATVHNLSPEDPAVGRWLRGDTVSTAAKGWTLLTVGGLSLSWGKASGGILKNHFPKGLRWL